MIWHRMIINNTLIYNTEDLDRVRLTFNLSKYIENYSVTSALQNYFRGKIDGNNENVLEGKLFNYKTKIIGKSLEQLIQTGNP